MNFQEGLERLREYYKPSNAEIEKSLGLSNGYISKIEKNPGKLLLALNEKGISTDWFLTGKGEMLLSTDELQQELQKPPLNRKKVPIFSSEGLPEGSFVVPLLDQRLSAGSGDYLPEEDEIRALIPVPSYLSRYGKDIAALTVDGDSMMPTLHRGDMVVCDSGGWSGEGIYAVQMGGSGFVKRITKAPGKIVIISDNPKYPAREEPEESDDIKIIGRVHCAITKVE